MIIELELQGWKPGEVIYADSNFLTVKARKEIRKRFEVPKVELVNDEVILAALEKQFSEKKPTQQEIYEGYMQVFKKNEAPEIDKVSFYEALCAACCRWKKGTALIPFTQEDFDNLPFEIASHIDSKLFTSADKSFLVRTPASQV